MYKSVAVATVATFMITGAAAFAQGTGGTAGAGGTGGTAVAGQGSGAPSVTGNAAGNAATNGTTAANPSNASPSVTAPAPSSAPGTATPHMGGAGSAGVNKAEVQSNLEKQGFTNVSRINRHGTYYTATAERDGRQVQLRIDRKTGQVTYVR